jgi:hypothetical protein
MSINFSLSLSLSLSLSHCPFLSFPLSPSASVGKQPSTRSVGINVCLQLPPARVCVRTYVRVCECVYVCMCVCPSAWVHESILGVNVFCVCVCMSVCVCVGVHVHVRVCRTCLNAARPHSLTLSQAPAHICAHAAIWVVHVSYVWYSYV